MTKNLLHTLFLSLSLCFTAHFTYAQIDVVPASAAGVCDGTATITNTAGVIQSSITWYESGAVIASNTYQIGNLCQGYYGVSLVQSNPAGGLDSMNYTFSVGVGANPCASLSATISQTAASTPTSNDGIMTANATGGNPPYSYMWCNAATTQTITNLPGGFNCCLYLYDMAGCGIQVCDTIQVLNPAMGDTLVVNGANCGSTNTTVYAQELEDCNFDFNACASAYLYYILPLGNDSIQANWNFVDTNGVITYYTINYYAPNPTSFYCYNLQFTLFCSVIKSSNVKTIIVTDAAELGGIQENGKNPFSVNNPMGNELSITFDKATSGRLYLYDMFGQILQTQNLNAVANATLQTNDLPTGNYILQIVDDARVYTQKVIK
ncbi:MAG: T9SS type A sorting domain-containing protein [Flavobacteriales bacterium]